VIAVSGASRRDRCAARHHSLVPAGVNELGKRAVVALIGAPVALGIIWIGGAPLATLASALAAVAAWEYCRLASAAGHQPLMPLTVVLSALAPLVVHAHVLGVFRVPFYAWSLAPLVMLTAAMVLRGVTGKPLGAAAVSLFGVFYTGVPLSFVYALRYYGYAVGDLAGALVVMLPVLLTWASDTGAYASGRLIGGRKLVPSISPGKTVAGAVGALVVTVVVLWLFQRFLFIPKAQLAFTPWGLVIFGLAISATAQVGDLAESLLKREAGLKDSGTLFPGHGGVLDRLDSLFFVLPVSYLLYDVLLIPAITAARS